MRITRSAISLNVSDPDSSAAFLERHLGFRRDMAADGFVSLSHEEAGFNVAFLRVGLPTFKPRAHAETPAAGLLIVFEVDDVDAAYDRMVSEGVPITTAIETEEWGERFFQITDPCGVVLQLVQWVSAPPATATDRGTGSNMR